MLEAAYKVKGKGEVTLNDLGYEKMSLAKAQADRSSISPEQAGNYLLGAAAYEGGEESDALIIKICLPYVEKAAQMSL